MNVFQLNESIKLLIESKDMLDISIKNADEIKNKEDFLSKTFKIEEKFDGTKLSIWRNDTEWSKNYEDNWVIAFKNQILFKKEFESVNREKTKKHSVGISQYAFVHDHLKSVHNKAKTFPKNTELFIEFIQNKLTTTRDYENKHGLYLIAYSPATAEVSGGMLKTKPTGFFQDDVEKYSKMLKLNLPPVVFEGKLSNKSEISKGIKNDKLKKSWEDVKQDFDENPYETVKKAFLDFESELGGKTEGVVLHDEEGNIFKFLQSDQHDKNVRFAKKLRYQSNDSDVESKYWELINSLTKELLIDLTYDIEHLKYEDILNKLNTSINGLSDKEIKKLFSFKFEAMRNEEKMS